MSTADHSTSGPPVEKEISDMSGTDRGSHVPPWAVGAGAFVLVAAIGALWATTQAHFAALDERAQRVEARVTAAETDAARRSAILDDLRTDVRDLRGDVRAGFDAVRSQISGLSTQIATPPRR